MHLDLQKLGAGLLGVSPVLLNLAGSKICWWIGVLFATAAPFLMAAKPKQR